MTDRDDSTFTCIKTFLIISQLFEIAGCIYCLLIGIIFVALSKQELMFLSGM